MAPAKNDPANSNPASGKAPPGETASEVPHPGNVDDREIRRFSEIASQWWDSDGNFAALHKLGPPRLSFIRNQVLGKFGRSEAEEKPLHGLDILDIGCGGGLISEPLSRLGGSVRGIDMSPEVISVAQSHAEASDLNINFDVISAEDVAESGTRFDIVLCLEVLEHVPEPRALVATCGKLVKPGGLVFFSTLNRTLKSYALAIVGAEYVLGWVPRGTHDWDKFVSPDELKSMTVDAGLSDFQLRGLVYWPLSDAWSLDDDTDVNYIAVAAKPV